MKNIIVIILLIPSIASATWTTKVLFCYPSPTTKDQYCYVDIKDENGIVRVSDMYHIKVGPNALQTITANTAIAAAAYKSYSTNKSSVNASASEMVKQGVVK